MLAARAGHGIKPGLERVGALLDALAAPHQGYPTIQVAGTNGKTSTTRFIAALTGAHGLATGSFTSPQLETVEDQFEYASRPMSPEELAAAVGELEPITALVERRLGQQITLFEMLTALGAAWFAERSVDLAVIEAGLGGRDDATNVVRSEVAVVTGVAVDHTHHLGATLEEAAAHKVGILDEGATLVTGPLAEPVAEVVDRRVRGVAATWIRHGESFRADDVRRAVGGWVFDVDGVYDRYSELGLRVRGRHQVVNFTVAVAAAESLLGRSLDEAAVREVAATISLPGRMEVVRADPLVLIDAAHNPDGMAALVAAVAEEYPTTEWTVVFGAMADKDAAAMARLLDPISATVVTTASSSQRALPPDDAARVASDALGVPVGSAPSPAEALRGALGLGHPVLVTGSIALVGEARRMMRDEQGVARGE